MRAKYSQLSHRKLKYLDILDDITKEDLMPLNPEYPRRDHICKVRSTNWKLANMTGSCPSDRQRQGYVSLQVDTRQGTEEPTDLDGSPETQQHQHDGRVSWRKPRVEGVQN